MTRIHHRNTNQLIGVLAALLLTASTARAESCLGPRTHLHDWTIRVGGYHYGLIGHGATTTAVFGQRGFTIPMHIFSVAGIGVLTLVGCAFLGMRVSRKRSET